MKGGCPAQNVTLITWPMECKSSSEPKVLEKTVISEKNKGKMDCRSLGSNFR